MTTRIRVDSEAGFNGRQIIVGAQMLFVAFGALVLVPLLTGLNPNVALFTAGAGTLLFQWVTQRKVPVFLASSFAFIAPIIYGVQTWGVPGTLCGLAAAGLFYILISIAVRFFGPGFLHQILPPIVVGPVIMVIGLILAPVAVQMAMGRTGDGAAELVPQGKALIVSMITLATTIVVSMKGRGLLRLIPILTGIAAGYLVSLFLGLVDVGGVAGAAWFAAPDFVLPEWNWRAIVFIMPVAIAPAIEHFGDILAIGHVTGQDYVKNPGIHRTMLGDGLATSLAAFLGGPPNTTYSEVTGAVALTRVFNPAVMTWAAVAAIVLAFVGKLGAFLQTIPAPVMGGVMLLLFGAITVVGLNTLVKAGEELTRPRSLSIVAVILVFGIGGLFFSAGEFTLKGIGLAGVIGVYINLVLPHGRKTSENRRWGTDIPVSTVLFSFNGRLSRSDFWLKGMLILLPVSLIITVLVHGIGETGALILAGLVFTILVWMLLALYIKRLRDRNRCGWWALLSLIPVANIWFFVETGFLKGSVGANRFGADPLEQAD